MQRKGRPSITSALAPPGVVVSRRLKTICNRKLELSAVSVLDRLTEARRRIRRVEADNVVHNLNVGVIEGIEHINARFEVLPLPELNCLREAAVEVHASWIREGISAQQAWPFHLGAVIAVAASVESD